MSKRTQTIREADGSTVSLRRVATGSDSAQVTIPAAIARRLREAGVEEMTVQVHESGVLFTPAPRRNDDWKAGEAA